MSFCNRSDDLITSLILFTFSFRFLAVVLLSIRDLDLLSSTVVHLPFDHLLSGVDFSVLFSVCKVQR